MSVKNVTLDNLGNILTTPFIMPSSRNLIKSGWKGDILEFSKKLCKYNWRGTRDYTMAIIILTIIVASSKAKDTQVSARQRDEKGNALGDKADSEFISLSDYINRKVSTRKIGDLLKKIVNIEKLSDSNNIANTISEIGKPHGWFAKCFKALVSCYDGELADMVFSKFLARVKKMTPWRMNGSNYRYMEELVEQMNNIIHTNIKLHNSSTTATIATTTQSESKQIEELTKEELGAINKDLKKYSKEANRWDAPGYFYQPQYRCKGPGGSDCGWKLHISPKPKYVVKAMKILTKIMKKREMRDCGYKFVHDLNDYINTFTTGNQAGKFITIYPKDDQQAYDVAESLHAEFQKIGMATDDYFITIKNDFKIYPGIYTRLVDLEATHDKHEISEGSRYRTGIPKKLWGAFLKERGINGEKYDHPFGELSVDGIKMPKKVCEINGALEKELINNSTWEPLTNLSQIPDDGDFELFVPNSAWKRTYVDDLVAIAKVTLPGHSDFKIVLVPQNIEKYTGGTDHQYVYPRVIETVSNLLECLEKRRETIAIKTYHLEFKGITKNEIKIAGNPKKFLKNIQKELSKRLVVCNNVRVANTEYLTTDEKRDMNSGLYKLFVDIHLESSTEKIKTVVARLRTNECDCSALATKSVPGYTEFLHRILGISCSGKYIKFKLSEAKLTYNKNSVDIKFDVTEPEGHLTWHYVYDDLQKYIRDVALTTANIAPTFIYTSLSTEE